MNFKVTTGKVYKKELLLITGIGGIGKSTFGAEAPNPLFIPVEEGSNSLEVARFPKPTSFDEVIAMLKHDELKKYETLVFDSLDHFEPLVWAKTVEVHSKEKGFQGVKNIEGFGFGKGYAFAEKYWREFLQEILRLRERMNIVLIAHCKIKVMNDPLQPLPYDKYVIKLQDRAKAVIYETVDTVLFANYEMFVKEQDSGSKGKAFGDGKRFLFTHEKPGHEAKNRDGLPYEIPMDKGRSWSAYIAAKAGSHSKDPKALKAQLEAYIETVSDLTTKAKAAKACAEAGLNYDKLESVFNKLKKIKGE